MELATSLDVAARAVGQPAAHSFRPAQRHGCLWGQHVGLTLVALAALAAGCHREQPKTPSMAILTPGPEPIGWLKGQTHLHSNNSGDSSTPPGDVVRYYAERGYDFIIFTDHNRVTRMPSAAPVLVIAGAELTQNLQTCDPPSAEVQGCNLHMNALFASPEAPFEVKWPSASRPARLDVYQSELAIARSYDALAQLNHPNFRWAADGEMVTELARRGVRLIEIANGSGDCNDAGDAHHPSTEALWDHALSAGQILYGVATDDAHHYYDAAEVRRRGEQAYEGNRGWVMVHAARTPQSIRAALQSGDFYASTGVRLAKIEITAESIGIVVAQETPADCEFVFVGTGGRELARSRGRSAQYSLAGSSSGYVRAVVIDGTGQKAWLQPLLTRRDPAKGPDGR